MTFTKLDPEMKMSETDTHVFFLNGPFSQWYPSKFTQQLGAGEELSEFHCAEQYMMASKAYLFGDLKTLVDIMAVKQTNDWHDAPKAIKELGRQVKNFDPAVWDAEARSVVFRGNWAKFGQDDDLREFLISTGTKTLVEGAHYDAVWGVKLAWNDPKIIDPANWKGTNWLGETLMSVRRWALRF